MNLFYIYITLIYKTILRNFLHTHPTRLPVNGQSQEPRNAYQ